MKGTTQTPDIEGFIPLTPADFHVLVALSEEPRHGYAIAQVVESASGGRVRIGLGSLYRVIARLLGDALIEESPPGGGGQPGKKRRSYRLTKLGLAVIQAETARLRDALALEPVRQLLSGLEGRP